MRIYIVHVYMYDTHLLTFIIWKGKLIMFIKQDQ